MANDADVFWGSWIRERRGDLRAAELRVCHTCNRPVRKSDPAAVASGSSAYGHLANCTSFDYATGLGVPSATPPGKPLSADVFWKAFVPERDIFSTAGVCRQCEGVVRYSDPDATRDYADRTAFGHDPDCETLTFAQTLGLDGSDPPEFGPMFGEDYPVFGSSQRLFGQSS